MKWREEKHSRRSGAEECWINRSDFSSKECMHTEQQALQCGALEFLKQQGMRSAVVYQHFVYLQNYQQLSIQTYKTAPIYFFTEN